MLYAYSLIRHSIKYLGNSKKILELIQINHLPIYLIKCLLCISQILKQLIFHLYHKAFIIYIIINYNVV